MVTSSYTTIVLTAAEGCYLTQANCDDIRAAIITERVYLANTDSPDNWREITAAEADDIKAQQAALLAEDEQQVAVDLQQQPQDDGVAD